MEETITIIEGPPPIFEHVADAWALGLNESPHVLVPALTFDIGPKIWWPSILARDEAGEKDDTG